MSVRIRLARAGAKKRPFYRVVVADKRMPRDGRFIEKIGTYNPLLAKDDENRIVLDAERIKYWLGQGAQPSERVESFLVEAKLYQRSAQSQKVLDQRTAKSQAEKKAKEEEAKKKAEEEAKAAAEEKAAQEAEAAEAAAAEQSAEEAQQEEQPPAEAPKEEAKAEEAPKEEPKAEESAPAAEEEQKSE